MAVGIQPVEASSSGSRTSGGILFSLEWVESRERGGGSTDKDAVFGRVLDQCFDLLRRKVSCFFRSEIEL